jgi:hypothetical protein
MTSTLQDPIPRPSEQPPEVDYLQHRQDEYQTTNVAFDVGRQQFVPDPRSIAARSWSLDLVSQEEHDLRVVRTTESFKLAVGKLKEKRKGKDKEISKFKFEGVTSWKDISQVVKAAETEYLDEDSASGKIRKFFRRVGSNGKSIQSFVGLLPDGNYKTLCGGITLVLKVRLKGVMGERKHT